MQCIIYGIAYYHSTMKIMALKTGAVDHMASVVRSQYNAKLCANFSTMRMHKCICIH